MDPLSAHNKRAWDAYVAKGNRWTIPVTSEEVAAARKGEWKIILTPIRAVPREWFPEVKGRRILCLAGSGGQQAPILAAAGGDVVVFDNSPAQLARDREVAARDGLSIETIEGDMRDLSALPDAGFDIVVHPCSIAFVPDVRPVFAGVARVLRPGGRYLAGFVQPFTYMFDEDAEKKGELVIRHALPYSDEKSLSKSEYDALVRDSEALVFSHSLTELIGGQLEAGLRLLDLYEDGWPGRALDRFAKATLATCATR